MNCEEFWELYQREYKRYESPGFQVVNYALGSDPGHFMQSIYRDTNGKWCVDRTRERSNQPYHKEFDTEEEAVAYMLNICERKTGVSCNLMMKDNCLISRGDVALRAMKNTEKDMKLLLEWLNNPLVLQYVYGEDAPWDMEKVLANFAENTTGAGDATACFILYEGKEIGYLQYYPVQEDSYKYNNPATYEKVKGGYGVDMFIGIPELWNQGIGKQVINMFGEYCKKQLGIHRLCADPSTENERGLIFWKKAGFVPLETIEDYDDSSKLSILMEKSI